MERLILLLLFSGWRRIEAAEACMHCMGEDYTGTVSTTVHGYTCQHWSAQTPHQHNFDPLLVPGMNLEENYCRNPDGELGPWCYTTSPSIRWGYCSVPQCITEPPAIVPEHTCFTGDGHLYRGNISVTKSGLTCQSWVSQTPHTHDRTPQIYKCR
ncbi:plasminogen-like [Triplophysa rosa]|uniref:plasminogen-like n=1 Tax=Triplophysa rosa TaxID=992332 RepID=UPI00254602FF|nr:plasminogen-like [Triplophysa rosa]